MRKYDKEEELINLYTNGMNVMDIADTLSINIGTIYNVINRNNIKLKTALNIDVETLIEEYLLTNNITELTKKYKISFGKIKKILIKNNVDTTIKLRKFKVNEDYFNIIDSEDKAYFLGLLYSDGYVNKEGFYLSLCDKDLLILETFKNYISFSGDIKTKLPRKEHHCVQKQLYIYSSKLAKSLTLLGCTQNKSHTVNFPKILDEKFHSHFIRGVFDGDGSVYIRSSGLGFSIIGNILLIEKILNILTLRCNLKHRKLFRDERCNNEIVYFVIGEKSELLKVYNYIYQNNTDTYMDRKYIKFKNFLYEKGLL